MSDYNYGLEPGIQGSGSSKARFALIFLLISAATAALLWFFWPGETKKASEEKSESTTAAEPVPQKNGEAAETKKEEKVSPPVSGNEKSLSGAESEKTSSPEVKERISEGKKSDDPTDPPLPDKGRITPADQQGRDLPVVPADGPVSEEQNLLLQKAASFLDAKKFYEAEKAAVQALVNVTEDSEFFRKAWRVLTAARVGIVYGGTKGEHVVRYRISSGDSLSGIAGRYFTTAEFLRKRNKISGSRIFVGRSLYVIPGDWKIVVSKQSRLLKLYRKSGTSEKLFAVWEIGIGRMGKTPAAEFAIASRVRHPDWYLPDGRVFKYGTPENQLGEYFLKLAPVTSPGRPLLGYGIHGTNDEGSVGRSLSSGCVRMRNADVEVLYYLVPAGCRVEIREK